MGQSWIRLDALCVIDKVIYLVEPHETICKQQNKEKQWLKFTYYEC